jgi:hypothetical protein
LTRQLKLLLELPDARLVRRLLVGLVLAEVLSAQLRVALAGVLALLFQPGLGLLLLLPASLVLGQPPLALFLLPSSLFFHDVPSLFFPGTAGLLLPLALLLQPGALLLGLHLGFSAAFLVLALPLRLGFLLLPLLFLLGQAWDERAGSGDLTTATERDTEVALACAAQVAVLGNVPGRRRGALLVPPAPGADRSRRA